MSYRKVPRAKFTAELFCMKFFLGTIHLMIAIKKCRSKNHSILFCMMSHANRMVFSIEIAQHEIVMLERSFYSACSFFIKVGWILCSSVKYMRSFTNNFASNHSIFMLFSSLSLQFLRYQDFIVSLPRAIAFNFLHIHYNLKQSIWCDAMRWDLIWYGHLKKWNILMACQTLKALWESPSGYVLHIIYRDDLFGWRTMCCSNVHFSLSFSLRVFT